MNDTVRNENVIAALRLAQASTSGFEKFGQVAAVILEEAADTTAENNGGLELLRRLHLQGALRFQLDSNATD